MRTRAAKFIVPIFLATTLLTFGADEPPKKLPPPDAAKLKEAEANAREVFKAELAAATGPGEKAALAHRLDEMAGVTKDDAPARYALRVLATNLAAQSGSFDLLLSLMDALQAEFEGDLKELRGSVLPLAAKNNKNASLTRTIEAYRTLSEKPDDPAANVAAGKYDCFVRGNWSGGLAMLLKSPNTAWQELIQKDLAGSDDAAAQIALGDAWWDAGAKEADKQDKAMFQERGAQWYRRALPAQSGIHKAKFEKRVADAEKASAVLLVLPASPVPATPPAPKKQLEVYNVTKQSWLDGKAWDKRQYKIPPRGEGTAQESYSKTVEAGSEIIGLSAPNALYPLLYVDHTSRLFLNGKEDDPIYVKNALISVFNTGYLRANWTIFEDIRFDVASKARFRNCIFYNCELRVEYDPGICEQFINCLIINAKGSSRGNSGDKHYRMPDYASPRYLEWNKITGSILLNGELQPRQVWACEQSALIGCKFAPDAELLASKDCELEAYIADPKGTPPVGTKERKFKIIQSKSPYPGPRLPVCTIAAIAPKVAQAVDLGKTYRWISKGTSVLLSSSADGKSASPTFTNGEGGGLSDSHSIQTNSEEAPWVLVDLGRRRAISAVEIENRSDQSESAAELTLWHGDSPSGPWNEVWQAPKVQAQWQVILDHAVPGRFIKVGLKKQGLLQLNHLRVFEKDKG